MAGKLPRVTEYIKNVGKSVGYASIDVVKGSTEGMSGFIETNDEFFKTIYSAAKNYKKTLITTGKIIKKSKVYDAAVTGIQATKEDLRSGNWYNKERESKMSMFAFGEEFADFSDFEVDLEDEDSWNMDDDEDIITKEPAKSESARIADKTNKVIAQAAIGSSSNIIAATREQSMVIASSAENIANVNMATAKMLSMQNEKIFSSVLAGFQDVHSGLGIVTQVMTGPMTQFMNESTKFYTDTSEKLSEMNAYLKEFTEMQRNLYKAQQNEYKNSKYDEILDSNNLPDLKEYGKKIFKNIKDLDPTGGALFGDGDDNMFKAMMGSPMKMLPLALAKVVIPRTVTASLKAFDESIKGLFPAFVARMNKWAEGDNNAEGIDWKGIIGSLLGIKIDTKSKISTGNYAKGPLPFDGETKKAIVDVIPAYLARIESALSGQPERAFDFKTGQFKTMKEIHKEFVRNQNWAYDDSLSSIEDEWNKWVDKTAPDATQARLRKRDLRKVAQRVYRNHGVFDPYDENGIFSEENIGNINKNDFIAFMEMMKKDPKKRKMIWDIANNTIQSKQNYAKSLKDIETQFGNPFQWLFNNHLLTVDEKGKIRGLDPTKAMEDKSIFNKSDKFVTTNDYLKKILANLVYIRENGIANHKGGKRKRKGTQTTGRTIDVILGEIESNEKGFEAIEEERDDPNWDKRKKEEKTDAEKYGVDADHLKEYRVAKDITGKWNSLKKMFDDLTKKPAQWITKIIGNADRKIFEVMFGSEEAARKQRDREGREYKGFLDYLVTRTSEIFDDLKDKVKGTFDKMWDKFKESEFGKKILGIKDKVKESLSNKFKFFGNRAKKAYDNTYGRGINAIKNELYNRGVIGANDVTKALARSLNNQSDEYQDGINISELIRQGGVDYDIGPVDAEDYDFTQLDDDGNIQHSAYGRVVKKYGLSMVSPGEIIIPNRGKGRQRKDLRNEKREKSNILKALKAAKITHYASGTVSNNGKPRAKSDYDVMMDNAKKVMHQVAGQEGDIIADSLIGGGVSLLTGAIGGPLLGAAVGASYGLVKNSDLLQDTLFGKKDKDGERNGGMVPKSVMDFFKKHSEGMIDFGMAGAVAGLFTPLGLVGGALVGATLGYAKDTKGFKDFMFGNEAENKNGLISKETQEKIKKAFPAIAIGAGTGVLFGPLGLIGNIALGSVAGYASTTDTFKNIVLGEMGDDNKRHGGIVGAFKAGLVEPLIEKGKEIAKDLSNFAVRHIIEPTETFLKAGGQFVKNMFTSVGDRIVDALNGVFTRHIGMPFEEFLKEKVFKRISNVIGGIIKVPITLAKGVVGAPFKLLGAIGTKMTTDQIARGTSYMKSAEERNKFREKHKFAFGWRGATGLDKTALFDTQLQGMNASELEALRDNMATFIKSRGRSNKEYTDKIKNARGIMVDYINQNGGMTDTKYNGIKQVLNAIQRGERPNERLLSKYGLGDLMSKFNDAEINLDDLESSRIRALNDMGMNDEALRQIREITGLKNLHGFGKGNNVILKRYQRLIESELGVKKKAQEEGEIDADGNNLGVPEYNKDIADNTTKLVELLSSINNYLADPTSRKSAVLRDSKGNIIAHDKKHTKRNREELKEEIMDKARRDEIGDLAVDAEDRAIDQRTKWRKAMDLLFGNEEDLGFRGHRKRFTSFINRMLLRHSQKRRGEYTSDYWGGNDFYAPQMQVNEDTKEGQEAKKAREANRNFKETLVGHLSKFNEYAGRFFGMNKDKDEDNEGQSLVSKLFNKMGGFGSGVLGILGKVSGGLKIAGAVGSALVGLSLVGWGSEFFKTKVIPWFDEKVKPFLGGLIDKLEQSETFQKIKTVVGGLYEGIKDGSLLSAFIGRTIQGVGFAIKNVVGPLTEAVISSFPDLVIAVAAGVGKGLKNLFFGQKSEVKTKFSRYMVSAQEKMPTGKDESEFANNFSGSWKAGSSISDITIKDDGISISENESSNISNGARRGSKSFSSRNGARRGSNVVSNAVNSIGSGKVTSNSYYNGNTRVDSEGHMAGGYYTHDQDGTYTEPDGSISIVSGDNVERYSANGDYLGKYDQVNGMIYETVTKNDYSNGVRHGMSNAFWRTLGTGSQGIFRTGLKKLANINTGGIVKSLAKGGTGALGAVTGAVTGGIKAAAKFTGSTLGFASDIGKKLFDGHEILKNNRSAAFDAVKNGIKGKLDNVIANGADDGASWLARQAGKVASFVSNKATDDGLIGRAVYLAKSILEKVIGEDGIVTKFLAKWLGKGVTPLCQGLVKISEELIKKGGAAKIGGKLVGKLAANTSPIAIGLWAKSLADGWTQTESILGVAKETLELTPAVRALITVVHALNENILFGLVPTKDIVSKVMDLFGDYISISNEDIEQARSETEDLLTQIGIETGKQVSINEYNNQLTFTGRLKKIGGTVIDFFKGNNKSTDVSVSGNGRSIDNITNKAGRSTFNTTDTSMSGKGRFRGKARITDTIGAIENTIDSIKSKIIYYAKEILKKVLREDGVAYRFLVNMTSKASAPLFPKLIDLAERLISSSKVSSKFAGKVLSKIAANTTPLAILDWGYSLYQGWTQAESIIGIIKNTGTISTASRALIALMYALNDHIFFGLVPLDKIIDGILDIFGGLPGTSAKEIKNARAKTEELLKNMSTEAGYEVTLEDYNNQDSISAKVAKLLGIDKNKLPKAADMKYKASKTKRRGKGRGGSQGGIFANMPYGNSTIGEAGCAPVAASMLGDGNVPGAAAFAQRMGHVASDGSTDIGFFNDYFSAKGISNRTTTDKSFTEDALKHGGKAVLLGRDPGGGDESAYSNSSHFITAKGMDKKGNVLIDDPELGTRVMSKNKVFRNMKASVVTGRGRYRGYGREQIEALKNSNTRSTQSIGDINSHTNMLKNANTRSTSMIGTISGDRSIGRDDKVGRIIEIARSQLKTTEKPINDCKYNDEFYGRHVSGNAYPWCCAFVWWVFHHAGADSLITKTASCGVMISYFAARNQIVSTPQPGDLVFFNFNGGKKAQHIGICIKGVQGSKITTIEGNTASNVAGSQDNGGGVYEKSRDLSTVVTVARPAYDTATFDDVIPYDGNYDYATGSNNGSSNGESPTGGLFEKLANLGKTMVKGIFGEGLYNAVFGSSDSSSSSGDGSDDMGSAEDGTLPTNVGPGGVLEGSSNSEKVWRYLRSLGYSKAGTAGIMGNLMQESGLRSNNLQNSFEKRLGSDKDYTSKVNSGSYSKSKFSGDSAGYGLAQWTYGPRKRGLYEATVEKGVDISSMKDQIDYLSRELTTGGMSDSFKSVASVDAASDYFLTDFEKPADIPGQKPIRRKNAKAFFNEFSGLGRNDVNHYSAQSATGMNGNKFNTFNKPRGVNVTPTVKTGANSSTRGNSISYSVFLETIINILLSISSNTEALNKMLDILSKNFNINVNSNEVQAATKSAKKQAKQALNTLMSNKSDAESVSHILQTKDTEWLVKSMTELARE